MAVTHDCHSGNSGNVGVTVPFQIGLQARLTMGPNRTRDRLRASDRRATAGPDSAAAALDLGSPTPARQPPANPVAGSLSLRDSPRLPVAPVAPRQARAAPPD